MNALVLDQTAMRALGSGNQMVSRLVAAAHREADRRLYVPALCLAAAQGERPGLADHIGSLPAIEVVELGFAGALTVGSLVADGVDWRMAHALDVGRPNLEWPRGRPVVTGTPEPYEARGVDTILLRT